MSAVAVRLFLGTPGRSGLQLCSVHFNASPLSEVAHQTDRQAGRQTETETEVDTKTKRGRDRDRDRDTEAET